MFYIVLIDYKYNVRGWLKNINQDANNDNDLFNFSLKYNDITDANKRLYNGNISQTSWNTLNTDTSSKTYTYNYDALNRILGATGVNGSNYNVSGITYDKNGNILSLIRNGHTNVGATRLQFNTFFYNMVNGQYQKRGTYYKGGTYLRNHVKQSAEKPKPNREFNLSKKKK